MSSFYQIYHLRSVSCILTMHCKIQEDIVNLYCSHCQVLSQQEDNTQKWCYYYIITYHEYKEELQHKKQLLKIPPIQLHKQFENIRVPSKVWPTLSIICNKKISFHQICERTELTKRRNYCSNYCGRRRRRKSMLVEGHECTMSYIHLSVRLSCDTCIVPML